MAQMVTGPATGRSSRVHEIGKVQVRNRALKPRNMIPVGPPTTQFRPRPGRTDGSEWLHQPTSEHVFGPLPAESPAARAAAASGPPWLLISVVLGAVAALVAGFALGA